MILKYTKEHNLQKLNIELMQLEFLCPKKGEKETDGVTFVAFIKSIGDNLEIRVERELSQEQIDLIDDTINKHIPKEVKEPTSEEKNRADIDYLSIMTGVDLGV